jgi:glycosyltransferase involved in cell wall biosynthesis
MILPKNNNTQPHVIIFYKNFAGPNVSHIGLGVAGLNIAKVLQSNGIGASVFSIRDAKELERYIVGEPQTTHVVISAPWIPIVDLNRLVLRFPHIQWTVNCHSNVGFLQADSNGVQLLRKYIDYEKGSLNFRVSGNSKKFVRWLRESYRCNAFYLPNLYFLDNTVRTIPRPWRGGTLKIGCFGATRPQKNLMSAAGAALLLKEWFNVDVELCLSSGRTEGGGNTILNAIRAMVDGIPGIKIVHNSWAAWPQFRKFVSTMNLLLQPSYTESFNMVTADGIAEGVPSVISEAIEWVPRYWVANMDDVNDIARVGRQLIEDPRSVYDGLVHLEQHNRDGFEVWEEFLGIETSIYKSNINKPSYLL